MRRFLALILAPVGYKRGYKYCRRCKATAMLLDEGDMDTLFHFTCYPGPWENASYVYALCNHCWRKLSPQQRLPYYRLVMVERNGRTETQQWDQVERAVLNGD
jgi:hypothetical protein